MVSPAKSLDLESKLPTRKHSDHRLLDQSAELVEVMAKKSPDDLQSLMSISAELAELNFERFQDWSPPFTTRNARPALLMFNGDTYLGLDAAATFGERDYTRAQKVLRILSGLYGVLRPLDLIQPYRLEMGSKVSNPRGRDLYDYWGEIPTRVIAEDLEASPGGRFLVNLASNEYFRAVRPDLLDGPVITPRFLDHGPNPDADPKVISFFAKRARGAMAGWLIRERIDTRSALTRFDGLGYRYDADRSTRHEPTFVRNPA